jgi:hypothetical protein
MILPPGAGAVDHPKRHHRVPEEMGGRRLSAPAALGVRQASLLPGETPQHHDASGGHTTPVQGTLPYDNCRGSSHPVFARYSVQSKKLP